MSDSMSAIAHDKAVYMQRCIDAQEEVRYIVDYYGNRVVDCYGDHAKELEALEKVGRR